MKNVHIVSLGCSKNLVDSEHLKGVLLQGGLRYTETAEAADILIINTCGFILPAKEESIDTILQASKLKEEGRVRSLLVMGCLSQRYRDELKKELPEVDAFFGVDEIKDIARYLLHQDAVAAPRSLMTPGHYAFLKIAEGCNNNCAYCAIPLIRGKQVSVSLDKIMKEAEYLAQQNVKELIVIAQDTTTYGLDLDDKTSLRDVLTALDAMNAFEWIRLHYTHPAHFDLKLIKVINNSKHILPYIDIPIQHIHTDVLRAMHRGRDGRHIRSLISQLKQDIPNLVLRSTVMVGFPGETDTAFNELLDFIKEIQFDRLGGFTYSPEEDTPAEFLGDPILAEVKQERLEMIMNAQQQISLEKNRALVGTRQTILIDQYDKISNDSYGRTYRDSPDIDNRVIIPGKLETGKFYNVMITDALDYDLIGEIVNCKS